MRSPSVFHPLQGNMHKSVHLCPTSLTLECFGLFKARELTSLQGTLSTVTKQQDTRLAFGLHHTVATSGQFSISIADFTAKISIRILKFSVHPEKSETAVNHTNLAFSTSEMGFI